jgi:hypothetical protein
LGKAQAAAPLGSFYFQGLGVRRGGERRGGRTGFTGYFLIRILGIGGKCKRMKFLFINLQLGKKTHKTYNWGHQTLPKKDFKTAKCIQVELSFYKEN